MSFIIRLSQLLTRSLAILTLLFAALGFFIPQFFTSITYIIPYLLGIIMFGMGLTLTPKDFSAVFTKPLYVLLGVAAQFIIMPGLAYILVTVFSVDPMITVGVLLVGSCPGGTSSNVITYLSKGDTALSVTVTSITTLMAPVATPFLLSILAGKIIDIAFIPMMISIIQMVLVPIFAGVIIRMLLKQKIELITPLLPTVSVIGIIMIVAIVVAANKVRLQEVGLIIIMLVILHNLLGYAIGYLVAKLFGLKLPQRKAIAIEVGMQNSGLGATLAIKHFDPIAAVPSAIFSVWHNISGAILANIFAKMQDKDEELPRSSSLTTNS